MNLCLEIFNDILNLHLRPWKVNYSTHKYQQLSRELKKESYQYQPLYDVAFIKPVNEKRKYYHALIVNAATSFLNELHNEIDTAYNEEEKTHWVKSTLEKKLKPKFTETRNLIEKKKYELSRININNDDAYIMQFLKYQLVRLYLEVQHSYQDIVDEEPLTEPDILTNYFSDAPFPNDIIMKENRKLAPERSKSSMPKPPLEKFVRHNHEIRDPKKNVLLYEEIVAKPELFGGIEEILFDSGYIDATLTFIEGKGKNVIIAAYAHQLKNRKVFKDKTIHNGQRITVSDLHIQRFISHRYTVNIDQQYRRFKVKKTLDEFLDNHIAIKF